jgi:heme oxygenase
MNEDIGVAADAAMTEARSEPRDSLSEALRARTAELHRQAERAGIVNDILRGEATRHGYALLLRNLLPAYEAMEQGLDRHRATRGTGLFAKHGLYRATALRADLAALAGDDWARTTPLLPAGAAYRDRLTVAAGGDGARLIAHAYARYMGDLSGGQILKTLLGRSMALSDAELAFYDFPGIADPRAFKAEFRDALDRAGGQVADFDAVVEEGTIAFQLNIAVSNAVQTQTLKGL